MRDERKPRAIVLFSGGLDSSTVLAVARSWGFDPIALIYHYGQRHSVEVETAARAAAVLGVEHRIQEIPLRSIGGSALTSDAIDVPQDRTQEEIEAPAIPPTYVPARNTIFLSFALAWAEVLKANDIFIGVNALDYSGYPDCRPAYIEAFERLARLATRAGVEGGKVMRVHAPLLLKTKAEIVRWGVELGVDYSNTWSCYAPVRGSGGALLACGRCDSCQLRKKGFAEAGILDPTAYA
jgi:7-cyano-7-deazaguanine synthase